MALFGTDKKKAEKGEKRVTHARAAKLADGTASAIIGAPWLSEKALLATERGVYAFEVPKDATKAQIASAVKILYKVEPKKIAIVNMPGKKKAMRTRRGTGTRSARRKAYVYLNKGDTIQFA